MENEAFCALEAKPQAQWRINGHPAGLGPQEVCSDAKKQLPEVVMGVVLID